MLNNILKDLEIVSYFIKMIVSIMHFSLLAHRFIPHHSHLSRHSERGSLCAVQVESARFIKMSLIREFQYHFSLGG